MTCMLGRLNSTTGHFLKLRKLIGEHMSKFEKNFTWFMVVLCMSLFVYDLAAGKYVWAAIQLALAGWNYSSIYADERRKRNK
jgi:hypothetical protein